MAQHFLLSAKARPLSLAKVFRMGEDAAYGPVSYTHLTLPTKA